MDRKRITTLVSGSVFITLGLLLLGTLIDLFESSSVYGWVTPIVLVFSGITTLQENSKYKTNVGYGLVAIGAITILVRLDFIRGDLISGLLGAVMLVAGSAMIARHDNQKEGEKS